MRDGERAGEMTAKLEEAIERSAAALDEACEAAENAPLAAECDDDPTWLSIEMDRWVKMPQKIREASRLGQLQVAVYWEQWFRLYVHPKKTRATLAEVLAYYRRCAQGDLHPGASTRWRMLAPQRASRGARLAEHRERFRRFASSQRCVEQDGAIYLDLADLLRDALCHWTGHWTFEGVVLDRYAGDEIDYGHYFRHEFREPGVAGRFERFRVQRAAAGLNRETTWRLFSPSGERIWRLIAVLAMDGNTDAFLLESEGEFLEVYASGS